MPLRGGPRYPEPCGAGKERATSRASAAPAAHAGEPGRRPAEAAGGLVVVVGLRRVCKYLFVCGRLRCRCAGRDSEGARFPASAGLGRAPIPAPALPARSPAVRPAQPGAAPPPPPRPGTGTELRAPQWGPRLRGPVAADASELLVARQGAVRMEGMSAPVPALGQARSCGQAPCRGRSRGPASSGVGRESTKGSRGEKQWARAGCVAETSVPPSFLKRDWPCRPPAPLPPPPPFCSWYSCTSLQIGGKNPAVKTWVNRLHLWACGCHHNLPGGP